MKRLVFLLTLATACAHRAPSVPAGPPLRSILFSISNVETPWLMRATVVGHVAVYPEALIVVAYPDTVVTLARRADPAASDEEVRVALASGDQNGVWRTDHRSAPLPLSALQAAAGRRGRDSVQFVIPGVHQKELANHWLVFALSSVILDRRTHQRVQATSYLHTDAYLFRH